MSHNIPLSSLRTFIEVSCQGRRLSDFMPSHFCNDIHGQLGFGVQRDHP